MRHEITAGIFIVAVFIMFILIEIVGIPWVEEPEPIPPAPIDIEGVLVQIEEIKEEPKEETQELILEDDAEEFEHGIDKIFGELERDSAIKRIGCIAEERKISFTIENPTTVSWHLDKKVPFPPPKGLVTVSIVLNSVEGNNPLGVTFNNEEMFGPKKPFSENCEGDAILEPGESTTCTVWPVPLKKDNAFDGGTNELQLLAPGASVVETFLC
ncbi:hypothetical protein GOV11_02735 [Candidatus Woesearchaeota archaeon]|nr:hypothetical protein [Candidatus Woesearchaeota archaeon]